MTFLGIPKCISSRLSRNVIIWRILTRNVRTRGHSVSALCTEKTRTTFLYTEKVILRHHKYMPSPPGCTWVGLGGAGALLPPGLSCPPGHDPQGSSLARQLLCLLLLLPLVPSLLLLLLGPWPLHVGPWAGLPARLLLPAPWCRASKLFRGRDSRSL